MAVSSASEPNASDPLRRTLDTLHLDPNAAADRPYLESMLRRLGYTEAEIQAYMAGRQAPAAQAPPPAASSIADDSATERTIEVEYTGAGLKEFKLVVGVDESELPAIQAEEAGTEVFEAGPSMEEVDRLVAEGGLTDFDDWGDTKPTEDAAGELGESPAEGEAPAEGGEGAPDIQVEKGSEAGSEIPLPEKVTGDLGPDFQSGEPLVEFQPTRLNEPKSVVVPDPAAEAEALKQEGWEVADPGSGEFEIATWEYEGGEGAEAGGGSEAAPLQAAEAAAASAGPFQYKEWTLYSRDELRGDQPQRIYFFSKGQPDGSEPASLPEGYEVAENPDTGRPFLRRIPEGAGSPTPIDRAHPRAEPGAPPKKRVRIMRVRAGSREEAIQKLQAEGRNIIASMPIDIEKRMGE